MVTTIWDSSIFNRDGNSNKSIHRPLLLCGTATSSPNRYEVTNGVTVIFFSAKP